MIYTRVCKAPVVTLLSSSPALSQRAQATMEMLFQMDPQTNVGTSSTTTTTTSQDALDARFRNPLGNKEWDSVVSKCNVSGTLLHFLSLKNSSDQKNKETLSLLSIIEEDDNEMSDSASIELSRNILAEHIQSVFGTVLKHSLGQSLTTEALLGTSLPLLQLRKNNPSSTTSSPAPVDTASKPTSMGLKEICVPFFDEARFADGSTFLSILSDSSLHRPAVGLYQFNATSNSHGGGLTIRPLPGASEDRLLAAPSFVFSCDTLSHVEVMVRDMSEHVRTGKIGFTGTSQRGQLMVAHPDLPGLDVRFTDSYTYSSSFPEAQDAMLAGSLSELQNENVLLEGGRGGGDDKGMSRATSDAMNGLGDCWVEFRANMKHPSGFFNTKRPAPAAKRIAKVPDIPYE